MVICILERKKLNRSENVYRNVVVSRRFLGVEYKGNKLYLRNEMFNLSM